MHQAYPAMTLFETYNKTPVLTIINSCLHFQRSVHSIPNIKCFWSNCLPLHNITGWKFPWTPKQKPQGQSNLRSVVVSQMITEDARDSIPMKGMWGLLSKDGVKAPRVVQDAHIWALSSDPHHHAFPAHIPIIVQLSFRYIASWERKFENFLHKFHWFPLLLATTTCKWARTIHLSYLCSY